MGWVLLLLTGLVLCSASLVAIRYGISRWQSATKLLRERLEAARLPISPWTYDPSELAGLPPTVQRYFRRALKAGQAMIAAADIEHEGTFNVSEAGEQWRPFTSTQRVIIRRAGFDWDARIKMLPGLTVCVHDAYIAGEGLLHATLFGLVTILKIRGKDDIAQGELMRFLAEAAWYPTALLPSQGVRWESVDDTSAKATLRDGSNMITMLFRFNQNGLIASIRADARGRIVNGKNIPTPWEGRWRNYKLRDGMYIPLEGEVAWILPQGPHTYWRGRITGLQYAFAK